MDMLVLSGKYKLWEEGFDFVIQRRVKWSLRFGKEKRKRKEKEKEKEKDSLLTSTRTCLGTLGFQSSVATSGACMAIISLSSKEFFSL